MDVINGKIDCAPETTGFDSRRIETLNKHFERIIDKKIIFGASYCISHKGKIIANNSIGSGDALNLGVKMQPDTVFSVASITKVFTAVAVMKLVEDGFIRLNTPVGEILPAFSKAPFDKINIWHLLTHTSGLYPDGGCFPDKVPCNSWELVDKAAKVLGNDFDWVEAGISAGLRRKPGSEWMYCSFGFAILGEIITRVSGVRAEKFITENILKPLGMTESGFAPKKELASRLYIFDKETQEIIEKLEAGTLEHPDKGTIWEKVPETGGGIFSTVNDLMRFANAMLNKGTLDGTRIIGRKALEKMTTDQLFGVPDNCWGAEEPDRRYGVGFDMRQGITFTYSQGSFMHEGWGACSMDIDPREELAATWFVPFTDPENGWSGDALYNVQNIIWSGLI